LFLSFQITHTHASPINFRKETLLNDQTEEDDHEAPLEQQKLYVTIAKQKPTDCRMWHNLKING